MEEASFLSPRIGILAKRLLDIGSPHHLRLKHADGYHIHLITASGPTATDDEYHAITTWMQQHIPGAELDGRPWHGQMRFSIPATHNSGISQETEKTGLDTENPIPANGVKKTPSHSNPTATTRELDRIDSVFPQPPSQSSSTPITTGNLFALLESSKAHLAISHYTVSPNTFDEVFLNIVRKHNIDEEDFLTKPGWKWKGWKKGWQRERPEVDNDGNGGPGTGEVGERGVETRRFRWKWKWLLWPYVR
jgi:ATP-binding cassette subfamily A (ABC1) protein 3